VKHPAIVGGFGCGKTRSIPLRWVRLIDWRAREQKRKARLMIVEPTYQMVRDVLVPEMVEFFNDHGIKHRYHKSNHDFVIRLNGIDFVAMCRSADKPSSLTGKTISDAIIDEFDKITGIQNQKDVWNECIARTRKYEHGTVAAVTTPEGFRYTYELWKERNADNPNFKLIKAKTRDNTFLPADYIDNMVAQYDSLLAQQYLEGEFVNLNNSMAYYMFRRDKHSAPQTLNPALPVYIGMDFNVNPMTAVVLQIEGNLYRALREYWLPNSNTRAMAQLIAADWSQYAVYICPDMTGGARKTSADYTDIDILKQHGFQVLGSRNITERARLNIVNNLFDKDRLVIDPKCKRLINDLEKVVTNEYGRVAKEKDSQLTHISDALGYAAVALENKPGKWGIR
nr:terminase family protein [Candidatus Cloacimonadota bacterium]